MLLYHGSTEIVEKPDAFHNRKQQGLDFGSGFYTTSDYQQAKRWALSRMFREGSKHGYVSIYEFAYEEAIKLFNIQHFDKADERWLSFVVNNRMEKYKNNGIDLSIGPVADDNVFAVIRFYETGVYSFEEALLRLEVEKLTDQWVFHNNDVLKCLTFIKSDIVTSNKGAKI